ncbi:MAG: DNA sulfur modification protein DndD [Candidatus Contendobacter sp.]|jgi:DNA sulfur modification protein DndD|nr:DNA sulfur modification protein DndD [Candidatus Contendobacter sp.]
MRFKKLTIAGYKSFRYSTEIIFPASQDGKSIFLIGGMNGAGKTSFMEAINLCLYGAKADLIFNAINRQEKADSNYSTSFELILETDDGAEVIVKRSWSAGATADPKPKDLEERLMVIRDGKRVSVQSKQMWQDFIRALVPPGITPFFFFDGEKIQEIAADDHSEVRLKNSLEAALGIEFIKRLTDDLATIKNQERQDYVDISDADLDFKQSELKKERSKLERRKKERLEAQEDLDAFRQQYDEAKKRFQATFNTEPEARETQRENEKSRIQAINRFSQADNEIKTLSEKALPLAVVSKLFDGLKQRIETERGSIQQDAIRDNAAALTKTLIQAVEEPEPLYSIPLNPGQRTELEQRIQRLLHQGMGLNPFGTILNLSEREAARILHRIEEIESSDLFRLSSLIDEKSELDLEIQRLDHALQPSASSTSERELFEQLQAEMEGCSTQIGRKSEQLRSLNEDLLTLEKRSRDLEAEISRLYERHNVSREKADFITECDTIASLLGQFIIRLRENKIHLLQEKTFEMYRQLSSKSGLIKDLLIDPKTYEVSLHDRHGSTIRKSGLSAGEKEIFAIALLWGLAQTSQLRLPIIIDTPLSRLDSSHRQHIVHDYFPNAGEQVVILSTDTEVDEAYYVQLEPYLSGAGMLQFDQHQELTTFQPGYFWER